MTHRVKFSDARLATGMNAYDLTMMQTAVRLGRADAPSQLSSHFVLDEMVALASAALAALPETECEVICEANLSLLRNGPPVPPFDSIMDEAWRWAEMASPAELRAYAWACFQIMPVASRNRFWAAAYANALETQP